MGLFGIRSRKKPPETEEERRLREAEEARYREAVRALKQRALLIRSDIRAAASEKVYEELTHEQFVRYAHILEKTERVFAVVPGHYANPRFSYEGPVHVLFLDERFVVVPDEAAASSFSFRYGDIGAMEKKRGIFESSVRFSCREGLAGGKTPFTPEGGWDRLVFYLKSEYKSFAAALEARLPSAASGQ